MEEPVDRVTISEVLNLGAGGRGSDLKRRLEAVAAREGMDATTLGRRMSRPV